MTSDQFVQAAVAAHEAEEQAKEATKEAEYLRRRQQAIAEIERSARDIGVVLAADQQYETAFGRKRFTTEMQIDVNTLLRFDWKNSGEITVTAHAVDQLYWDLPPGQEDKLKAGGTYGCYNTGHPEVRSLAELGCQIVRNRKARELWQKKHGVS